MSTVAKRNVMYVPLTIHYSCLPQHSGSCYLFDCGKPEDLKCQFTDHSYYTSAVLRANRHQLDFGMWSEQSQHEAELTNLR